MRTTTLLLRYNLILTLFLSLSCILSNAQEVGINTTTPEGILDIHSTNYGVVLPRVALTDTNIQGPVINPQGGGLVAGTVIYNTNTTGDVVPGIYVWTGTSWFNKFTKKQAEFFTQSTYLRPESDNGFENIPGLTSQSFEAEFTGTYKVELSVNYGGGILRDIDGDSSLTDVAVQDGRFRFVLDGTTYNLTAHSYSAQGTTNYYLIWEQYTRTFYKNCIKGQTYNFNLSFDQGSSPEFINDGNHDSSIGFYSQGTGYIGFDIPCSVEVTYLGD